MGFDFTPNYNNLKNASSDIVLVLPNMSWLNRRIKFCAPFTALTLTAIIRQGGYDFTLIDATSEELTEDGYVDALKKLQPKIVLVSSISVQYASQTHLALKLAKETVPSCTTVHGGIYATTYPQGALKDKDTDFIFIGPAENRLPRVLDLLLERKIEEVRQLEGIGYVDTMGNKITTSHPGLGKMKKAIEPDYSKVDIKKYLFQKAAIVEHSANFVEPTAVIQTSFGCVYDCTFCGTVTISGRSLVYREVEIVLDEIGWYIEEFGITHFGIIDEMLMLNKKRAMKLFQGIIDRKYHITWKLNDASLWHMDDDVLELMKLSGCVRTGISAESGSQRVLDDVMNKPSKLEMVPRVVQKCKELGIDVSSNFIIGMPDETWAEILETVDFANRMDFDLVIFNIAQPFPGTAMVKTCMEKGYMPKDFDFTDERQFGNAMGFIETEEFTPRDLADIRTYAWEFINFKNHDKKVRAARCLNIPLSEIDAHRRENRMKKGRHVAKQEISLDRGNDNRNGANQNAYDSMLMKTYG